MDKEKKLIKLIQKKSDKLAANELVSLYYKSIYSFVYKQTLNKELSMDLTQEIFISMLKSIHQFDVKKGFFKAWLYKIASNRLIDYYRSKHYKYDRTSNSIEELQVTVDSDFTRELEYKEDVKKVTTLINELDTFSRQIVRLKLFTEITFSEIAKTLDIPESSVKTKYYSTIKKLKYRMETE